MEKNSLKNSYDNFLSKVIVGIGEVSEMTKIPVRKLRYWEEKGIIKTVDPQSKSRQFDLANIKKIILIQELIDDGYSLDGASKKVEERISKIGSLMTLIEI
ncbi:MerR family transcriptional regulator [Gilliamella sp. B3482]|uniref:MerR family transcriptional regulator n=1 Tax=Gilliamella sp. B3482 TaxID=2817991 RepID=UPI00226ADC44|nr:MerR family transcriptional regulator [Gilliamella sp. B3482]MCX8580471.1 MerR family transcriptional regulator [Gilliamella sp. B3482]